MKVKTLKERFQNEFHLTLKVYKNGDVADDHLSLSEIRAASGKGGDLSARKNTLVKNIESNFEKQFGIKVEVFSPDGTTPAPKDMTLQQVVEMDSGDSIKSHENDNIENEKNSKFSDDIKGVDRKRYFRVKGEGEGGEFVLGQVSQEFVEYWTNKDEGDDFTSVWDHLSARWPEDQDPKSPKPKPDDAHQPDRWYEYDDIEHITGLSYSNGIWVEEVRPAEGTQFNDYGNIEWIDPDNHDYSEDLWVVIKEAVHFEHLSTVYTREISLRQGEPAKQYEDDEILPVVAFFNLEKGYFWDSIVETENEDFDIDKFYVGAVDTIFVNLIEQCWYDRKLLYLNTAGYETNSMANEEFVGLFNKTVYDKYDHPDIFINHSGDETEAVKNLFDELNDLEEEYEE